MRIGKCRNCKHCSIAELICRPESKDCHSEYALDAEDLDKFERCDFYEEKESEEDKVKDFLNQSLEDAIDCS